VYCSLKKGFLESFSENIPDTDQWDQDTHPRRLPSWTGSFTGKDFIIIDFEGEPGFSFSERRLKKRSYKDVAGIDALVPLCGIGKILLNENYRDQDIQFLESWAEQWQHYVGRFYLGAYMEKMGLGAELPHEDDILIRTYLIEKAVYELGLS